MVGRESRLRLTLNRHLVDIEYHHVCLEQAELITVEPAHEHLLTTLLNVLE